MATVYVNDKPVDIGTEQAEPASRPPSSAGVFIPHYCWHPALSVVASCRMCLVEVGEKKPDGTVAMQPQASCPAARRRSRTAPSSSPTAPRRRHAQAADARRPAAQPPARLPRLRQGRRVPAAGLQLPATAAPTSRMIDAEEHAAEQGPTSASRSRCSPTAASCARAACASRARSAARPSCRSISRGHHAEIDIFPGEPLQQQAGRQRRRSLPGRRAVQQGLPLQAARLVPQDRRRASAPTAAPAAASTSISNKDIVYRLRPRENPQAQGYFMCDEGRFGYHYVNSRRAARPARCSASDGKLKPARVGRRSLPALRSDVRRGGDEATPTASVAVLSPFLTLRGGVPAGQATSRGCRPTSRLALGPVPVVGEDDTYPKDRQRQAGRAGEVHDPRREVPEPPRRRGDAASTSRARCSAFDDAASSGDAASCRRCT